MAWIESHTVILRHRKLISLAADLNIRKSYAMGHIHALWHTAIEQQENGDLSTWSDRMIAQAADYPGSAKRLIHSLKKRGWLEQDRRIHDWWEYAGPFLRSKYKRTPWKWESIRTLYVIASPASTDPTNLGMWGDKIKKRDSRKCVKCGSQNEPLHAHHIKPQSEFPELRYSIENGVTLCALCHKSIHGRESDFVEQFTNHVTVTARVQSPPNLTKPNLTEPNQPNQTKPHKNAVNGFAIDGQQIIKSLVAETAILSKPWHFKGNYYGVRIHDLPAAYCEWAIKNLVKMTPEERLGCELVIKRKRADCAK